MDMIVKSESLASVADAIRTKGETTEQLVFPDGFSAAIMAIESGGVSPQLIVSAPAGSTIVATNGEKNVTGVVGTEGTLTLDLPEFGTWTVTATLNEQEASTSVHIEQEYPVSLSYTTTFTVNGGHGETITIYENGENIGTVTLDSTGTGTVTLDNVGGKTLVFTGSLSGYERTIDVGSASEMTVNVYPDGAIYWFGRQFTELTGGFAFQKGVGDSVYGTGTGSMGTNSIVLSSPSPPQTISVKTKNQIDLIGATSIEFNFEITSGDPGTRLGVASEASSTSIAWVTSAGNASINPCVIPLDENTDGLYYVVAYIVTSYGTPANSTLAVNSIHINR